MFSWSYLIFFTICCYVFMGHKGYALRSHQIPFAEERSNHRPSSVSGKKLNSVSEQSEDLTVFRRALRNILVPRVVGTESHRNVQNYIISEFVHLGWSIEEDAFTANTPIGTLPFKNIVATYDPRAKRFLDFACHYDSKYYPGSNNFVGATDSAVPCAMLIQMAYNLQDPLRRKPRHDVSLRFIFFDGEEAFRSWSRSDSLYGARHLAKKWQDTPYPEGGENASQLDRIDMLILLDLLGAKNPEFYSFFPQTQSFYKMFANAETKLAQRQLLEDHNRRYFHRKSTDAHIEDDHLPFLERGVPIVHLITVPFPREWHTPADNRKIVDMKTTRNLIKIMTIFVIEYLDLDI